MIGLVVQEPTAAAAVARIKQAEDAGVPAVWMTIGGAGGADPMATFAAAGAQTSSVLMGTAIVPNMPRHPIIMAQQAVAVAQLAPGRFRLGIGPSHQTTMQNTFGFDFKKPLSASASTWTSCPRCSPTARSTWTASSTPPTPARPPRPTSR